METTHRKHTETIALSPHFEKHSQWRKRNRNPYTSMLTSTRPGLLIQAVLRNDLDDFASLLQSGEDYLDTDSHGWTVLDWAISQGQTDIIRRLLEHHKSRQPAAPSTSTHDFYSFDFGKSLFSGQHTPHITPLELAASNDDLESFELLLDHLEPPSEGSSFNGLWTPSVADKPASRGSNFCLTREDVATYLQESRPWNSRTRLAHLAIHHSKPDILRLLLKSGTDINGPFLFTQQTLLHTAAFQHTPQCIRLLLAAGADPSLLDDFGRTALQQAIGCCGVEAALALIEAGAPVDMCSSAYQFPPFARAKIPADASPLMLACGMNGVQPEAQLSLIRRLLDRGANVNASDRRGRTALHVAAIQCDVEIIKALLEAGADPATKSQDGRGIYHYFAQRYLDDCQDARYGQQLTSILNLFLSRYDPRGEDMYDNNGTHPLEIAAMAPESTLLHLLVEHGFVADKLGSLRGVETATTSRDSYLLQLLLPEEDLAGSGIEALCPLSDHLVPPDGGLVTLPPETVDAILATIAHLDSAGVYSQQDASDALLLVAQHFRNPELVEALLDCGAQFMSGSQSPCDLVHEATVRENNEVLHCLLNHRSHASAPVPDTPFQPSSRATTALYASFASL